MEFEKLFTKTRPHILEMICLSLDYDSFKRCLKVNNNWTQILTSKAMKLKIISGFAE